MNAVPSYPVVRRLGALALGMMLLSAAVLEPVPTVAQSSPLTVVKMGLIPIDDAALPYYGVDMGFFKKAGLDVQISQFSNGAAIAAAIAAGSLDVSDANVVSLVTAHSKGLPFAIIAPSALHLTATPSAALLVSKDSAYTSAKSLDGKTIAVNGLKNITELSGRSWIDKHGGESATIKFVEMPMPQMPAALQQNRVDAAIVSLIDDPSIGTPAAKERMLGNVYDGIATRFQAAAYFSTTDWIAKNPETARKFMTAMHETAVWANANRDKSAQILAQHTKVPIDLLRHVNRATYGTSLDLKLIQPVIDTAAKYELIAKAFPAEDLISPIALPR